jgi:hypothetical protein
MKFLSMTVLGAVGAAVLAITLPAAPAAARDSFAFSFDVGNVRMGYSDGYWDNNHQWHSWRNSREHRAYRNQYHDRYANSRHNRHKNGGWRDNDGDGVPNRQDDHPNNPRRD